MKQPKAPRLDERRAKQFETELFARARAWIPSWGLDNDEHDFGRALLRIAARFNSEVAERLDGAGDKMRLGFIDWLALQGKAARPARLPVVFKLTDNAANAVLATAETRLQVEAAGAPVILETEKDVRVLPGKLSVLVGVDADSDAFYLPPPGLSSLEPLEPLPTQWQLKSFASTGATKLQLDPELGLATDMLVELGGQQYRIAQVDKDIVTIDPPLTQDYAERSIVNKVTSFAPFDGAARNQQQHVLYLGDKELLDIESAATIEIVGAKSLANVAWQYWGKRDPSDDVNWQDLTIVSSAEQAKPDAIVLSKPKGSVEILELVKGSQGRWIRAFVGTVSPTQLPVSVDEFEIRINCQHETEGSTSGTDESVASPIRLAMRSRTDMPDAQPSVEAMANTTPLVLDGPFFPFGKEPRQFDTFYLGSKEAFSKKGADVVLNFQVDRIPSKLTAELSWEYWTGTGWWKLDVTHDGSGDDSGDDKLYLKTNGTLKFKVPLDLSPTDWSGRTNYWIRARLIGGDYGRERVSLGPAKRDADGVMRRTVERFTDGIHPPSVTKLSISYAVCESVPPTFVLTKDSGSLRDQSDANRTGGANVEAFVPIGVLLGRLSGPVVASTATEECRPDCNGPSTTTTTAASPVSATPGTATPTTTAVPTSGRAMYLGFNAGLSGAPVNVLLLVQEERPHDDFAPMTVEALVADRFVPIVAHDTTRALGESGVLSLAFAIEPTPRELFGQTLTWLRLTPKAGSPMSDWKPTVRGAYLNAVWASAAETLTRELVGSSQGEPNLTLYLAKPPILQDTLELRVNEPLGDEERDELNAQDKSRVLSTDENLPGDWVLWDPVVDPGDESAIARVYSLDEATGEIRFGDGQHGAIPPVGSDSIVAFKYRRTEVGAPGITVAPANTIAARTALNLVSPVEGVEAVFAADQAAGGALPEEIGRVLRFGVARLRHRERALTASDLEDIVLESSPDIAQARCFLRGGFVRLVVVMRGPNPMPSAAQIRELRSLLLAESPPSLGATQALRIGGPAVRRLRVDLRLRVASLDDAGEVANDATKQIVALFDTATGGIDKDGWTLGDNPGEGDIAMALAEIPRLEGIADVALREISDDGTDRPWPEAIKSTELAMLAKDPLRIEFEAVGELA